MSSASPLDIPGALQAAGARFGLQLMGVSSPVACRCILSGVKNVLMTDTETVRLAVFARLLVNVAVMLGKNPARREDHLG